MQASDWQQVWDKHGANADDYFAQLEPEMDRIVRKQSKSVIAKVRRNLIMELWATAILGTFGLVYIQPFSQVWWLLFVIVMLTLIGSSWIYWQVIRKLQRIESRSLRSSISRKIEVLSAFVRRLKFYAYILLPIIMLSTFCFTLNQKGEISSVMEALQAMLEGSWILVPGMIALIWFSGGYVHWLYGRYLVDLKGLLGRLEE